MKVKVLLRSNVALAAGVAFMSAAVQLLAERLMRRAGVWGRLPLLPWLCAVAWAGTGVQALRAGRRVLVGGRILRLDEIEAVELGRGPSAVRRSVSAWLRLRNGAVVPVRCDAGELAAFLGIDVRSV